MESALAAPLAPEIRSMLGFASNLKRSPSNDNALSGLPEDIEQSYRAGKRQSHRGHARRQTSNQAETWRRPRFSVCL